MYGAKCKRYSNLAELVLIPNVTLSRMTIRRNVANHLCSLTRAYYRASASRFDSCGSLRRPAAESPKSTGLRCCELNVEAQRLFEYGGLAHVYPTPSEIQFQIFGVRILMRSGYSFPLSHKTIGGESVKATPCSFLRSLFSWCCHSPRRNFPTQLSRRC
jgi:hypothetical protein